VLAERKQAREERQESVDYYAQKAELPGLKAQERTSLQQVHAQVLQDVLLRLKTACDAFFRRFKAGETPGYPRFGGRGRCDSLTFPRVPSGCALEAGTKRLVVAKVGRIKVLLHRPLGGRPKTATLRRTAMGKRFVTFACAWKPTPPPPIGREVGLDVGLTVFAMPSTGEPTVNPRFFRKEERALTKAARKHQVALNAHKVVRATLTTQITIEQPDREVRQVWQQVSQDAGERAAWGERQRRRRVVVARTHERIRWRRSDFSHQESRRLVAAYDFNVVEDLSVRNMVRNHALAKSIHDAAWTQCARFLACKAAWAGRRWVAVDPKQTSQTCLRCGWRSPDLTLDDRVFHCLNLARPDCRLVLDRDRNAAVNILARSRQTLKALGC
jgi:putative transposase